MRGSYFLNYFSNLFKWQYRGMLRYSGEYNIILGTLLAIYIDHFLEKRIRRDLQRLLTIKRSVEKIKEETSY